MDFKIIFAILSSVIGIIAFLPYLYDIFKGKTRPHAYTWLLWAITQTIAFAGIVHGGGGIGALGLGIGTVLVISVFIISLRFGTRNITFSDKVFLVSGILALLVWLILDSPIAAVILVSAIDLIGYAPSFRKSFNNPWSETTKTWFIFVVANIFAILAMQNYNLLTLLYIVTISTANFSLAVFCLIRRKQIKTPSQI